MFWEKGGKRNVMMMHRIRILLLLSCFVVFTVYLLVAAIEDGKNCEVTRWKHWIGFIPGVVMIGMYHQEYTRVDIAVLIVFALFCIIFGLIGVYGLADGFTFGNLTLFWGGIGGVSGIGMVILIMVLACMSGLGELLLRKGLTLRNFKDNKKIPFLPHILCGYGISVLVLFLCIV